MKRVRGMKRLFRFPWRTASQIRDEVDAEIEFHLAIRAEELERRGMSAADASRETRERFGDVEGTRRALRQYGELTEKQTRLRAMTDDLLRDTLYAWRSLRRSPGFSAVAIVVLALGIGVNSAMFNLADLLVVRSLHVAEPERVVGIFAHNLARPDDAWRGFSYHEYRAIRDESRALAQLAAFTMDIVGLGEHDDTRRSLAAYVSSDYFRTLGVPLALGREFSTAEERDSGAATVVLSHAAWLRNGADPNVVGTTVRVNGELHEVVGVAAEDFTGSSALVAPDLWLPMAALERLGHSMQVSTATSLEDPQNRTWMLFGRMAEDASAADVAADLATLTARIAPGYPSRDNEPHEYVSAPLPRLSVGNAPEPVDPLAPLVGLLIAMSGVVLLIACLNLANMFLARGAMRRTEIAIRQSLGGGRARLVRQFLTEGLLLALASAAIGLMLGYWGTSWLLTSLAGFMPLGITLPFTAELQPWVTVATAGAAVAATLVFALGPALKATRTGLTSSLKERGGERVSRRRGVVRAPKGLLIAAQMALSLMLLTAGGLFVRAAFAAAQISPGYALEPGLIAELDPALIGYDEPRAREVFAQALALLRALPQVEAAALASNVAFNERTQDVGVRTPGAAADSSAGANYVVVGEDYFDSLGLPLLRGRGFTAAEARFASGSAIAIIDEPLANRLFGSIDVVGRQLEVPGAAGDARPLVVEIVGVAPGVRQAVFDRGPSAHLYLPLGNRFESNLFVHVRAAAGVDPSSLLRQVRDELRALDPALPVLRLETLRQHRDGSVFVWMIRTGGQVFAVMGLLALALAAVGIYGVRAFVTAGRTREIGVRMALGATSGSVVRQLLRESLKLTVLGLALGLALAVGIARLLQSLLFEVSAFDPLVFLASTAVLAAAALLATYLPARRASRIDPLAALRHD
jgi:predicted permease